MTSDDVLTRAAPPPDFVVSYAPVPGAGAAAGVGAGGAAGAGGGAGAGGAGAAGAGAGGATGVGVGGAAGVGVGSAAAGRGDAEHVADVRLPPAGSRRPAPLVLFLHGGFWRAAYDRTHTGPLAAALAAAGFIVCVPEFRRTGHSGGGWPGTFDDVAAAVDTLPVLVRKIAGADVVSDGPVILGGHSAGGHLALWAAARHRLPAWSRWHPAATAGGVAGEVLAPGTRGARVRAADTGGAGVRAADAGGGDAKGVVTEPAAGVAPEPDAGVVAEPAAGVPPEPDVGVAADAGVVPVAGVVALAAVSDLGACHALRLGRGAAAALLGGGPRRYPERYLQADPARLLPLGCPVRLVHGSADDVVPCSTSSDFLAQARAAGDDATLDVLPGAGHYDVIDPLSAAWSSVLAAFGALAGPG